MEEDKSVATTERLVTYLDRKKRKRTGSVASMDSMSSPSPPSPIKAVTSSPKTPKSPKKSKKTAAKISSKGPKKVEGSLPGPSPKRSRQSSEEPIKVPTEKKSDHVRSTSAAVSLKQAIQASTASPVNEVKKPESVASRRSSARKPKSRAKSLATDDDDIDDNASVADSVISNAANTNKIRRSEAERIEYFKNQSECGTMEPHSVQCLRCNKSVNLGKKQTYAVRPWETHRSRCDQKPAQNPPATPAAKPQSAADANTSDPQSSPIIPAALFATPAPPSTPHPRLTEEQRKTFLEEDKQIESVEPYRVCCIKCQKWVDLSQAQTYASRNWTLHKTKCTDIVPSERVSAAKRRLLIVNDAQVKSFTPKSIECALCGKCIALEGEGDFNLVNWNEHKAGCTKAPPLSRGDSINSPAFAARFSRPPVSTSSSGTLVANVPVPSAIKPSPLLASPTTSPTSLKRSRDQFEASQAVPEDSKPEEKKIETEERPSIRRKLTEMLMMPFQSLVRGFKDSLT